MSENGQAHRQGKTGFRVDQIPALPGSPEKRERLGEDLQPVGDYAGIEPYCRVCEDVDAIQHQDQEDPDDFEAGDWWWDQRQIRFLNGKAFLGLSALLLLIPYVWGTVLVGGGEMFVVYCSYLVTEEAPRFVRF
ncbi:MAG: hypothetical protein ABJM11_08125 [Marinobacter sp.]|uniref:hypothetical protein n=1 Tax=Marinobacter sp. TaxID=50741 RepID=UPI003297412D